MSRKSQSPRKRNHVWKFTKSQKTFSTPQNFTKSQKSPEHPFPHLQSLCELYLSVSFFSLCGLPLSELYLSVSRDLHCFPKTIQKNNCFSMFLRFQAFLESFKSQDGPTKNIKKQIVFQFLGISGVSRDLHCCPCRTSQAQNSFFCQSIPCKSCSRNKSLDA